jgi:hypothetical protein
VKLKNLLKKNLLLMLSLMLFLNGCTYRPGLYDRIKNKIKKNQTPKKKRSNYSEKRRSGSSDADINARGGCDPKYRTRNNKLRPAAIRNILIGMEKQQVVNIIGFPHFIYESKTDEFGHTLEIWGYYLDRGDYLPIFFLTIFTLGIALPLFFVEPPEGEIDTYWLHFYDDKFTKCENVSNYGIAGTYNGSSGYSGYSGISDVTGYGEISNTTGRVRNNIVSGHYRSNGTYVNQYARS